MDIVFLRNGLIYFDVSTKSRFLQRAPTMLQQDGYWFLGGAETTMNLKTMNLNVPVRRVPVRRAVRREMAGNAVFYRPA